MAQQRGADLRTGVAVSGWTAGPDGVTVHCGGFDLSAGALVLAPGAWAAGLTGLEVPLRVERRVQHYWRPVDDSRYGPDRMPVWIWERGDDLAYGMPLIEGSVKAALHHFREEQETDPEEAPAAVTPAEVAAMRDVLATRVPGLAGGEWIDAKPCLYTLTPDEAFVLGNHPQHPEVAVACGFSGHGFKFAPVIGAILADLVLTSRTDFDITIFDPSRFGTPAATMDRGR
jgi:sarcosine oxidase